MFTDRPPSPRAWARRTFRRRPEPIGPTVLWSASEHLLVEAPLHPPHGSRRRRHALAAVLLLACLAVIAVLVVDAPGQAPFSINTAAIPAIWAGEYTGAARSNPRFVCQALLTPTLASRLKRGAEHSCSAAVRASVPANRAGLRAVDVHGQGNTAQLAIRFRSGAGLRVTITRRHADWRATALSW